MLVFHFFKKEIHSYRVTLAGLLRNKLVMDMLSPQPNQESLPLASEMQVAMVALLGKMFECFMIPRDYPLLLLNSQAIKNV